MSVDTVYFGAGNRLHRDLEKDLGREFSSMGYFIPNPEDVPWDFFEVLQKEGKKIDLEKLQDLESDNIEEFFTECEKLRKKFPNCWTKLVQQYHSKEWDYRSYEEELFEELEEEHSSNGYKTRWV